MHVHISVPACFHLTSFPNASEWGEACILVSSLAMMPAGGGDPDGEIRTVESANTGSAPLSGGCIEIIVKNMG
jgi:hypothetical protein